jgi:hypothetical protein
LPWAERVLEEQGAIIARTARTSFTIGLGPVSEPTQTVGTIDPTTNKVPKCLMGIGSRPFNAEARQLSVRLKPTSSYKRKRTMSLIDEFNAAIQSLDRILEKMEEADPADKERLEAYVKSMQVKVQQILKAILRVH